MEEFSENKHAYRLSELNSLIKTTLDNSFPDVYWVIAEIADIKSNQKGHCYLELVEKEDDRTTAQIRATIWAYEYRNISLKFEKATNEPLKPGMKILLLSAVTFHEVYGLSLNVRDIDPSYTIGEMALRKKEVIDRLRKERIIDLNKKLPLPPVPQRIAVISSPKAAGYGDFINQIDNNPYGYRFMHILFPSLMQGPGAEQAVIKGLNHIALKKDRFDIVAIIRGGGSAVDLSCFDGYPLASLVARFPLPVITGIGHEKDDSVVDIVAHTRLKTPTAVAEFVISGVRSFEEKLMENMNRIQVHTENLLKDEHYTLDSMTQRLSLLPLRTIAGSLNRIETLRRDLSGAVNGLIEKMTTRFLNIEQAVKHLDPANVLKRGYSITRHKGKTVRDASRLKKWAVIETKLHKGTITSIVQGRKEAQKNEQNKADTLLPGFE